MRWSVVAVAAYALLLPSTIRAQTDFSGTTLKPGQHVRITDPSGLELRGVITSVVPMLLLVDGHSIRPEEGLKVERLGDRVWNGAAIGFVVGSALGAVISRTGCFHGATIGCVVKPGLAFGAIGALIDHAHVGHSTVFLGRPSRSTALLTFVSSESQGLLVQFSF